MVTSNTNTMLVVFTSDGSVTKSGFTADYYGATSYKK